MSMEGGKTSREKSAKMSKSRRENAEVQSSEPEDNMAVVVKHSSSSSSSKGGTGTVDPIHRLTFRADPELLEPKQKQLKKSLSRNEIEKLRRDRLNAYFMELAKLVPLVMQSTKKIDKASILRLTVAYLRIYHDLVKGSRRSQLSCNWRPDLTMYENLGNLLLESFGGFLLVISKKGILVFATEAITKHLGHNLSDVLGSEVTNIIHPNDHAVLQQQFERTERDSMIKDTDDETDLAHVPVTGQRSFFVKMLNVLDPQSTCYEVVHLVGHLKRIPPINGDGTTPGGFSGAHSPVEPSVCLVVVAKLISRQPIQELYPDMASLPNQWITRHELDGKITYSDQRGALLTGFLPVESIGFSPYSLLHPDDIASVVAVHNLFLTAGHVPQTVFRMYTKSREILYIQTNTHLVADTWTSKPRFIISTNMVLDENEGLLALEDQKRRIQLAESARRVSLESDSSSQDVYDCYGNSSSSMNSVSSVALSSYSDCVTPEVEVSGSSVVVVVGDNKHWVNLLEIGKLDPKNAVQDANIAIAFDSHATEDDGGKSIPNVKPSFVCDPPSVEKPPVTGIQKRSNSLLEKSSPRLSESSDGGGSQTNTDNHMKAVVNSVRNANPSELNRRRFSNGDVNHLAAELLKTNGHQALDPWKNGGICDRPVRPNNLLRQLLTEKFVTSKNDHLISRASEDRYAARERDKGRNTSGEFCQIKSLLQELHDLPQHETASSKTSNRHLNGSVWNDQTVFPLDSNRASEHQAAWNSSNLQMSATLTSSVGFSDSYAANKSHLPECGIPQRASCGSEYHVEMAPSADVSHTLISGLTNSVPELGLEVSGCQFNFSGANQGVGPYNIRSEQLSCQKPSISGIQEQHLVHYTDANGVRPGLSNGAHPGLSNGVHQNFSNGAHPGLSNGMHQSFSNGVHPGLSNGVHQSLSNGAHPGLSNGVHQSFSNGAHPSLSNGVHPSLSNGVHPSLSDSVMHFSVVDLVSQTSYADNYQCLNGMYVENEKCYPTSCSANGTSTIASQRINGCAPAFSRSATSVSNHPAQIGVESVGTVLSAVGSSQSAGMNVAATMAWYQSQPATAAAVNGSELEFCSTALFDTWVADDGILNDNRYIALPSNALDS